VTETVGTGAVVRHGRSAVEPEAHPRLASVPRPDAPRCELRTTDLASGEELLQQGLVAPPQRGPWRLGSSPD